MTGTDRKAIAAAIFDPGATEGLKGERTLTEWQTDAVMRALTASASEPEPVALERSYYTEGKDCPFYEALSDKEFVWEATKMAQDLADMDTRELEKILPFVGVLALAADRIERLANPGPTPDVAVEALANKFAIFSVEEDEKFIRLSAFGEEVACWPADSQQGIALLKLEAERQAALSHPADGWRDISTAPRDGTHFLAYETTGEMYRACYVEGEYAIRSICGQPMVQPAEPEFWLPLDALPERPAAPASKPEGE